MWKHLEHLCGGYYVYNTAEITAEMQPNSGCVRELMFSLLSFGRGKTASLPLTKTCEGLIETWNLVQTYM